MKLSDYNIKKFLTFSQKKAFLIFEETETPKKFPIFQKTELSYISGNGNSKKLLIFQERTFRVKKSILKKFLIFQEMELSSTQKLNNLNKTPLGETGCLSNLHYLLAAQESIFLMHHPFLNAVN